ncbi:hypothetical protein LJC00_04450, partial [Dysgonomonas sp. OttesenSCG-928-M03]|nr:hypothetical protein [Dysgonomonas sp. OttesenSCG-928-M03]
CANSTSNTNQEQTAENKQDNKPTLQFTPEEIAYNDSVKNLKMDYVVLIEEITANIDNPKIRENLYPRKHHHNCTQQEAYLHAYYGLCDGVLTQVPQRLNIEEQLIKKFIIKHTVKILNKDGKDITPLIDFPDRRIKEDSVWNRFLTYVTKNPLKDVTVDMYSQPIFNKGDTMVLELNKDLLEQKP